MNSLFDLCVKITADDSEYQRGVNNSTKASDVLSAKTVAMGQIMADAFEAVISKVAEYGQKVIDVGMEQETALAKVNTIMDTTKMSTDAMADGIRELSNAMGVSTTELSDTVYNAISATGDTENALALAGQASKLAVAGFSDTSSALGVLTTAMNAYGMSAEEAEHISDSLITVQNLGVTTVGELSSVMGKAIASGSAYGVNLENLESAYISLTKAGINTAEGTTYLSSMMKELGDDGSQVSQVLQEVSGKSFSELMAEGASLGDVLEILNASVDGDATALMNLWSSAEAGKASSAIMSQGIDAFNDNLKELKTTTGTTEKAFETMAQTLEHQVGIFKSTGENLMGALYEGLSGNLGDIVGFGTEMLNELGDAFEEGGIDGLAFKIGDVVSKALNKLVEYVPNLINVAFTVLKGLASGFTQNMPVMVKSVMEIVNTIVNGLTNHLPEIIQMGFMALQMLATGIAENLPTLIPAVIDMILTIVDNLISNVDLLIDSAIAIIIALAEGIMNSLPILITKAPEIIFKLVNALISSAPKLLEASLEMVTVIGKGILQYWVTVIRQVPTWVTQLKNTFINYVKTFTDIGKNIVDGIKNGIANGWQALKDYVSDLAKSLLDSAKDALGIHSPSREFARIGEYCVAGFKQGISELSNGDVFDGMTASLRDMGTTAQNIGGLGTRGYTQIINVNQQISTADELARVMRTESRYGLMRGVALG